MRYALWNNKGGVGKTFLSFILGTELSKRRQKPVVLVDMCPQANLSEIVLGGNGEGSKRLDGLIKQRKTIGGYFDSRIASPHAISGKEADYLIRANTFNKNVDSSLFLIAGDPCLEVQAQVINQIGGQTLPVEAWKNVRSWLRDIINECEKKFSPQEVMFIIDCNPSFSAYTELSMIAAERLIVPCSSDGSSARAMDNVGNLLYGIVSAGNSTAIFSQKAAQFNLDLPQIHTVLLNRSTQYSQKSSKAFGAMFGEIKSRTNALCKVAPKRFTDGKPKFEDMPDSHSVAIVCSHQGKPLYDLKPGKYTVHSETPQVNDEPLQRYKDSVDALLALL